MYRVAISPETRSKSKKRPPTASSAGDESRRWRNIVERPRDAAISTAIHSSPDLLARRRWKNELNRCWPRALKSVGPWTARTTSRGATSSQKRPSPWTFCPSGANPSGRCAGRAPRARCRLHLVSPAIVLGWRTCFCGRAASPLSGAAGLSAQGVARRRRAMLQRMTLDVGLLEACLTHAEPCRNVCSGVFRLSRLCLLVCYSR